MKVVVHTVIGLCMVNEQVEISPSDTVLRLKENIEKVIHLLPATQRLVYAGQVLDDEKTLEHYHISYEGANIALVHKMF